MDKRNWPWKKKSSDKSSISNDLGKLSPSRTLKPFDDQAIPGVQLDRTRTSLVPVAHHQADEAIRRLNDKLLAADDLAKQHATVAEEAVSGWETAKAEYTSVKFQLDMVLEQKQAAEVRVSHLDAALKECMQQLRQIREEQEQKIHETVIKRSRDWDKMRLELEERLVNANQQLVEGENQRNLIYTTMQEQAESVSELGRIRSQAEAEIKKLQVQVQTLEKENTSLKYEIVIVNKELDIRNQEREINTQSFEMANRQQLESTVRIGKLEAECQKLRALVRKKLPGPGALLQMKLEAGMDGDFYSKRRSSSRPVNMIKASHVDAIMRSERSPAFGEEAELLAEAFGKRNKCLQAARLPSYEGQVGHSPQSPRSSFGPGFHAAENFSSQAPSQVSVSEDANDDSQSLADSWTSSFITESAYSPKNKSTNYYPNGVHSHKNLERLNSIDDFLEIERLVSLPSDKQGVQPNNIKTDSSSSIVSKRALAKDAELQEANKLCAEVNKKVVAGEGQLSFSHSKNATNEVSLYNIHQKLVLMLQACERGDSEMVIENLKKALSALQCGAIDELPAHALRLSNGVTSNHSTGFRSLESSHLQERSRVECVRDEKVRRIGPELTSVVCRLVRVVEELASEGMAQHVATSGNREGHPLNATDLDNGHQNIQVSSKPRLLELEASVRNFTALSNQYLYGKVELVQFMAELCSVLSQVKDVNSIKAHRSLSSRVKWRTDGVPVEQDVFSDVGSPLSLTSNSDASEALAAKDDRLASCKKTSLDGDLRKVRAEKEVLESHLKAELGRMASVEQMLAELKQEKSELKIKLEEQRDRFDSIKSQLLTSEHLVATLRTQLASAELSRSLAEKDLCSVTAAKEKLEAQLEDSHGEVAHLHEKLRNLEREIDQEFKKSKELQLKAEVLLQRENTSGVEAVAGKGKKEQDIVGATEKLAECQRTILNLEKQLKGMVSAQDGRSPAIKSSITGTQEETHKDELQRQENTLSSTCKDKQQVMAANTIPDACSVVERNGATKDHDPGPGFKNKASDLSLLTDDKSVTLSPSHAESDKPLALKVSMPSPKRRTSQLSSNLDMSKSVNLERPASPRRTASSLARFFSKNKSSS